MGPIVASALVAPDPSRFGNIVRDVSRQSTYEDGGKGRRIFQRHRRTRFRHGSGSDMVRTRLEGRRNDLLRPSQCEYGSASCAGISLHAIVVEEYYHHGYILVLAVRWHMDERHAIAIFGEYQTPCCLERVGSIPFESIVVVRTGPR